MDEIDIRMLDAAEALFELNPNETMEKWVENLGYNLGTMGTNKPIKTLINSNKISKKHTLKMAIKKALKPLF